MITVRHCVLIAILSAAVTFPARADTCHLTVGGRLVLDDEACTTSARAGTVTIKADNGAVLVVRRSILSANLPPGQDQPDDHRRYRVRSYGRIVQSENTDGKLCYFNQAAILCIDSGGLLQF